MKGTIHVCLTECIAAKYGQDNLEKCFLDAGLPEDHRFSVLADIDEEETLAFIGKASKSLGISL